VKLHEPGSWNALKQQLGKR